MIQILSKAKRVALQTIHPQFTRPTSGRIIITSNCPLRCKMCTFWKSRHVDPSLDLVKHWIREMADFGIKEIAIGGGEPFVRQDLTQIVKEIRGKGILCSITTSGYLVGKVPFPPVDECVISIDGANPETHDEIRGMKGSWAQAIDAVKVAKRHCIVKQVNFVVQKDNYHELVDFCRLAEQLDVPVVLIPISLKLAAQSHLSETLTEFDIERLKILLKEAIAIGNIKYTPAFVDLFLSKLENGGRHQRCMAPYHCILVYSNGDIYPCGNLDTAVGNLSEEKKLVDLYDGYDRMRKEIWSGEHPFCRTCIYPDIMNRSTLASGIKIAVQKLIKRR